MTRTAVTQSFATGGTALELWDEDGDGRTADLMEECGAIAGSFGLRRRDLGLTSLYFDPQVPSANFAESLRLSDVLLPAGTLTFYSEHLEEGAVIGMDKIDGYGISKLAGTSEATYDVYGLVDAEVTVLSGPRERNDIVSELNGTVRWRLRWDVTFGTGPNGAAQVWSAEDVIDVTDRIEMGDETLPPDWDGPRPTPE